MKRLSKRLPGRRTPLQRFLEANLGPVKRYIHRLSDLLVADPSIPLVLLNRVSTKPQATNGHLEDDRQWCLERLAGCNIVGQFGEVGSGRLGSHRKVLREAIELARQLGAVLVVSSRERLIRAQGYDGTNASDVPGHDEYQELMKLGRDVTFATILKPTKRGRSFQIKRGQQAKLKRGGRPKKSAPGDVKRRRLEKKPLALKMRDDGGWSVRGAARELEVPFKTLHDWWQKG